MSTMTISRGTVHKKSAIERRFWATATTGGSIHARGAPNQYSGAYSLFILDASTNEIVTIEKLDPAGRTNYAQYQFPMAPQQYNCSEPAATVITPTQDGGKFIESQGGIFKDISISGTVGFRPSPVSTELIPGLNKATGVQLSVPNVLQALSTDDRGLPSTEATGFDDIIFLRNIFRAYWDAKSNADTARKYVLVWVYAKESEAWVVEPMQFTTNRESSKPLSWTYQIQLRTLYPLDYSFRIEDDALGMVSRLSKISSVAQALTKSFQDIGKFFNEFYTLASYVTRLPFDLVDGIIGGAMTIMYGIVALKNTNDFSKLQYNYFEKWHNDLKTAYYVITGASNNDTIPTGAPANYRAPSSQTGKSGEVAKALRDGIRIATALMTNDILWTQNRQVAVRDYSNAYLDEFGEEPITYGSPLNVSNITIPDSAKEVRIQKGESLRSIAKRLLGDEAYWKQLAILNNLKAPYISSSRSSGVLAYGDSILIPKAMDDMEAQGGTSTQKNTDASVEAQSDIMKQFGRDLRLVSSGEDMLGDLDTNQRGDLSMIDSVENVYQAVMIKFSTEQGELATHPTFGAKFPIGSKFPTLSKLQEFSINSQMTLRQDPRVQEIDEFSIGVLADKINVEAKIKLRNADVKLPISFVVRR
jgi:hypothetical protein